ncbi:MAG: PAS domain S-box protein, partial [Actinomycetota bacterium]
RVMAEKKFRTLLDSSPDAIIVADEQGKIALVNLHAERMFGYKREELIGRAVETLMPERLRSGHVKHRTDYGANPESRPMGAGLDLYAVRKDGGEFPVDIAISPIRTPEGLLVMSSIRDLTETKRNQADLRRANRNLKTLSEFNQRLIRNPDETALTGDLCRILIEHGKYHSAQIVMADPEKKTGPRVMARAGCWKAFPDQGSDPWKGSETGGRLEACAHTGRNEIANHILTDPERVSWRAEALRCGYGSAIALPLTDAKDRTYGTLMVSADEPDAFDEDTMKLLTELAGDLDHGVMALRARIEHAMMEEALLQNQTQLRQSQKMDAVGKLAGGIAHDFNNLLTAILGCSEFLLQNLKPDDSNRADVLEIAAAGKRAAALTKQLLAFSRKQMLQPKHMDLNVVVNEMQSMLRRLIGEDIELLILSGEKSLVVKVDRGQTEQVIMNLAINARD